VNLPLKSVERLLEQTEKSGSPMPPTVLGEIAQQIGKMFEVAQDEVAIMEMDRSGKALKFLVPEKLQTIGAIPLSSTTALAARTARESRADIVNNFSASRHASVFEGVPLGRRQEEVIHKIMSTPILVDDKVAGVAQISRKGSSPADSGPDFTQKNLRDLQSLNAVFGRLLALNRGNPAVR
jgi:hypothetical protein